MGGTAVNITGTMLTHEPHRLCHRTSRIDLIIHYQGMPALNVTNETHGLCMPIVTNTPFLYNRQGSIQAICQLTRLLSKALISSYYRKIVEFLLHKVTRLNNLGC